MIFFSHKKRIQRDRDAGLVFHWRGRLGENRGGLVIAVVLCLGFFGFLFWALDYGFTVESVSDVQTAELMVIGDLPPEMKLWSDQNSPFPPRWDPAKDEENELRVNQDLQEHLVKMAQHELPWRALPEIAIPVTSPPLLEPGKMVLGPLPDAMVTMMPSAKGLHRPIFNALGALKMRMPEENAPFMYEIPAESYGMRVSFIVSIDESGRIIQCVPAEWQDGEMVKKLENWVRIQRFKPSDQPLAVGEIRVRIGVKKNDD